METGWGLEQRGGSGHWVELTKFRPIFNASLLDKKDRRSCGYKREVPLDLIVGEVLPNFHNKNVKSQGVENYTLPFYGLRRPVDALTESPVNSRNGHGTATTASREFRSSEIQYNRIGSLGFHD